MANNLTRPFLPRGVLIDSDILPLSAEPQVFNPFEICVAYWRPRIWFLSGQVRLGIPGASVEWSFDIPLVANNQRAPFEVDPVFDVEIPAESVPETEEDLTRTYGTTYDRGFRATFSHEPGGSVAGEGSLNVAMFTRIARRFDFANWKQSEYRAEARIEMEGDDIGGRRPVVFIGQGPGNDSNIPVAWQCVSFSREITAFAVAINPDVGDDVISADISGSIVLGVRQYWGYADRLGKRPKFDTASGQRITYADQT